MFTLRLQDDSGEMDAIVFAEDAAYFLSEVQDNLALCWKKLLHATQTHNIAGSVCLKSYVINLGNQCLSRYRIFDTKLRCETVRWNRE
jgi:hypothetical protein